MVSIKVQLNKYSARKDGTYPLVFQVIYRREKRLIYSPYHLFEKEFDENRRKVLNGRSRRIPAGEINSYIDKATRQLRHIVGLLQKERMYFTTRDIVFMYKSNKRNSLLTTYFKSRIQLLKEEGRTGTAGAYQSTLNCLVRFIGEDELFSFKDITEKWVNSFMCFLRRSGLKTNTVNFYLRILRAVYNKACKEGIESPPAFSPFQDICMSNVKTRKIAVDKSIIQKIARMELGTDLRKELARDLFLFSFYCRGMPFVDMAYLTYDNIVNGYICYSRHKTGQPLKVKITGLLQQLIDKYKNEGEYVLPILKNRKLPSSQLYRQYKNRLRQYNKTLKSISNSLNLHIPLSSYVSRHSWATLARENGIPVSVISEGMGHSSEKTTYAYLSALNPSHVDKANEKVINNCFCCI